MLEWAIGTVTKRAYDELAPAIDRVWHDEIASIARDLRGWLDQLVQGRQGVAARALRVCVRSASNDLDRDPRSVPDPARVDGAF